MESLKFLAFNLMIFLFKSFCFWLVGISFPCHGERSKLASLDNKKKAFVYALELLVSWVDLLGSENLAQELIVKMCDPAFQLG